MSGPDDTQVEGMYFSVMRMNMIHNVHYVLLVSLLKMIWIDPLLSQWVC